LSYQSSIQDNLGFNFGIALGAYVIHSITTTTDSRTYMKDFGEWKKGDVSKYVSPDHFTAVTPGGEGSIGFACKLSPSVSLGITGRLILISKIKAISEETSYYQIDWTPAEPELVSMKYGNEYGGIDWSLGASLSF